MEHNAKPPRERTQQLNIAVDLDGVLFDHIPYVLRGFRDLRRICGSAGCPSADEHTHGIDLQEEGFRFWDYFQYRAVREKNLTWSCVKNVLSSIDHDAAIHELGPRDPHAARVMGAWMEAGHRVRVVTARESSCRSVTEGFLRANGIPHHELVMDARVKTGHDILVDDAPHNVLMAAADGGLALLMDQPYNRDVPTKRNPLRVHDWHDVEAAVARAIRLPITA